MSATAVRTAIPADIETLAGFNAAMAWETEHKRLDPETVRRGVAAVFERPARGFYLVAERAGAVLGALLVTTEWSDWRNCEWWWIQSVYVRADSRRLGVFRALYVEVERRARASGAAGLRLYVERENDAAQRTYERLGFEDAGYHLLQRGFTAFDRAD
jgi:ribosomal protein S18 acetylase RimI-like enzyme